MKIKKTTLTNLLFASFFIGTFISPVIYSGLKRSFFSDYSNANALSEKEQAAAIALQEAYINIYKKASPSVVFIKTNILQRSPSFWFEFYRRAEQAGSGVILNKKGYIITNNHVVQGADKIEVIFFDNTKYLANIIGSDESSDIALIKVSNLRNKKISPATLGNSDRVRVGQLSFALGAPFGLDRTFTVGIISALQRQIDDSRYSRIQTDASINPGNSGGPLLNVYGEVIGINQSILSSSGGNVGIGFAIPINEAKSVINQLKKEKRVIGKPSLGIQIVEATQSLKEELGVNNKSGVLIVSVVPGSAAEAAGLKEYDYVMKVNDKEVTKPKDLIKIVQKTGINEKVKLSIIRNKKEKTIIATVGEAFNNTKNKKNMKMLERRFRFPF